MFPSDEEGSNRDLVLVQHAEGTVPKEAVATAQTHLYLKRPIDAFKELLLLLPSCSEGEIVEVPSVDTVRAEQGSPGASTHRTTTPPVFIHVARRALLRWAHSCKGSA